MLRPYEEPKPNTHSQTEHGVPGNFSGAKARFATTH
jgi:hypothetical protein